VTVGIRAIISFATRFMKMAALPMKTLAAHFDPGGKARRRGASAR